MSNFRPPLRRHPALQPLSRQHHQALLLAQLLKQDMPDYQGLPDTVEGKLAYARRLFDTDLAAHFAAEEEELIPAVRGRDAELDALCDTIVEEHRALAAALEQLEAAEAGERAALLDALGRLLEAHVRREERTWFERIQEVVPEDDLQNLNLKE